jgi:ABC-type spermidine/putrescine transport system permease subunit I
MVERVRRVGGRPVVLLLVVLLLVWILVLPLIDIVRQSLAPGFSTSAYSDILSAGGYTRVMRNTLVIAVSVTVLTVAIAVPLTLFIWNLRPWLRVTMLAALSVPFWAGALVTNFSWTVLLQDNGVVADVAGALSLHEGPIDVLFTRTAVLIAMVHTSLPLIVIPLYASLASLDRAVPLAARSLGAGPFTTFRLVILPLTRSGLVTGTALVFIVALGYYITPAMLGGRGDQMVATVIDVFIRQVADFQLAAALAVLLGFAVLVVMPVALRYLRGNTTSGVIDLFAIERTSGGRAARRKVNVGN